MLSLDQMREHLASVEYKDVRFEIHESPWEGPFIRILYDVPDTYNEGKKVTLGINSFLPPFRETQDFDLWLQWRLWRIEGHESREFFKVKDKVVFDPHAVGEPFHM